MREIEFRGKALISIEELDEIGIKHKNGYVYGDLVDNSHIVTGILESNDEYICIETWCGIDSETIGQYTGLKDKSDNKIFEGDIGWDEHNECYGVVKFEEGKFLYVWENIAEDLQEVADSIEICGNIHENPELLEEK
ncbi:hypothetical protein CW768_11655 [Listeria monocytogenes]|uniref:YopX family protein n=1 Tax=Listeria monocytogenes TaxID=1639 RepID=UPI000DC25302|nr:YopX family protein [Listeria monocytogenes]EAC3620579.1 hypothetical protein [Listeria monocytogenes]EAC7151258.1 hypothetical protein [Listeria monocytogenes]EAF4255876.1 hypothetical protein [Listeria monocytogenes]EAF4263951.1 hypothetical protein [Listeria monocytogenes]EAF6520850.1 hypothetical protein [Listeria monocytogenes]